LSRQDALAFASGPAEISPVRLRFNKALDRLRAAKLKREQLSGDVQTALDEHRAHVTPLAQRRAHATPLKKY
jgi:hypothetical protein